MTLASASYALATRWDESRTTDVSELDFGPGDTAGMDTNQISGFFPFLPSLALTRAPQSCSSNAFNQS